MGRKKEPIELRSGLEPNDGNVAMALARCGDSVSTKAIDRVKQVHGADVSTSCNRLVALWLLRERRELWGRAAWFAFGGGFSRGGGSGGGAGL